jgi:hypothetical protein
VVRALGSTPLEARVWDEVVAQFPETASVARRCRASLVVLAAQAEDFPADVRDRIAAGIGPGRPHLLLTKQDLEGGHRDVQDPGPGRPIGLDDLLPDPFPERVREPTDRPRTINTGHFLYTR